MRRPVGTSKAPSPWRTWQEADPHHLCAYPPRSFTLDEAQGTRVITSDGRSLVDLGGASQGVALLGHRHPEVVAAIQAQLGRAIHVAQTMVTPQRKAMLSRLHGLMPSDLQATFLTNSGTEAVECALKLAAAATGRCGFVAARGGFHGRSLGSLRVTQRPQYRSMVAPLVDGTSFVPFNDAQALSEAITRETAAVVLEPVQGEGGVNVASPEYLRAARDLAEDAGALLVLDEVQTGLGRTGSFLACEQAGVVPDVVAIGKGLAGGLPMGACSVTPAVADALGTGGHGSTYGGNPLACAASAAVLEVIARDRLWERSARVGGMFRSALAEVEDPRVRSVRGMGLMVAVELRVRAAPVLQAMERSGFLALSAGKNVVRFLPPLVIGEDELIAAVDAFRQALEETPSSSPGAGVSAKVRSGSA